jgi:hypothetical protein
MKLLGYLSVASRGKRRCDGSNPIPSIHSKYWPICWTLLYQQQFSGTWFEAMELVGV